jgi:hypothetical protein
VHVGGGRAISVTGSKDIPIQGRWPSLRGWRRFETLSGVS